MPRTRPAWRAAATSWRVGPARRVPAHGGFSRFCSGEDLPWAAEHRRRLEEIRIAALECYAAVALGVGGSELGPGERIARELVAAEPYRERGHALLMEILTARGNGAEALRVYEQLRQRLRDDLGATPAPELRELQARLLRR